MIKRILQFFSWLSITQIIYGIYGSYEWLEEDRLVLIRGQTVIQDIEDTTYPNSLCRDKEIVIARHYQFYAPTRLQLTRLLPFSLYHLTRTYWRHKRMAMHLYFVTEPDVAGVEGEPLLGSAGKDPDDAWVMLASNREREVGTKQNAADLKAQLTARGYVMHKYLVKPLQP